MTNATSPPSCHAAHHSDLATEDVLKEAETWCEQNNLRLTPNRRRVLWFLLNDQRALTAYELLDRMSTAEGSVVQPPVVYRALNFLTENGLAHKIERLSAFVACAHYGEAHSPAFMICKSCHLVSEAHLSATQGALGAAARATGFQIEHTAVEAVGICDTCLSADTA